MSTAMSPTQYQHDTVKHESFAAYLFSYFHYFAKDANLNLVQELNISYVTFARLNIDILKLLKS